MAPTDEAKDLNTQINTILSNKLGEWNKGLETIKADQQKFDDDHEFVVRIKDMIKVNVGGKEFTVVRALLIKEDSIFKQLFSGKFLLEKVGEAYFIDRDWKHFDTILTFLRDGNITLPTDLFELRELRRESKFYGLKTLRTLVKTKLKEPLND